MKLHGYVVMPDHIHLLLRPLAPATISDVMRRLKSFTAHEIGQGRIWSEGFWSELVPNDKSLFQKLTYIHNNPLRAGLARQPHEYLWSSACEYLKSEMNGLIDKPFGKAASGR